MKTGYLNYICRLLARDPIRRANTRNQIIYAFDLQEIKIRKANTRSRIVYVPNENFECSKWEDDKFSLSLYPTQKCFLLKAHHRRLCSGSKSVRSSLIYLSHPSTPGEVCFSKHREGFVLDVSMQDTIFSLQPVGRHPELSILQDHMTSTPLLVASSTGYCCPILVVICGWQFFSLGGNQSKIPPMYKLRMCKWNQEASNM